VRNWKEEYNRAHANPVDGPKQIAAPSSIVGGALVALMVMQIAKAIGSH
jgi:hypothetical protein